MSKKFFSLIYGNHIHLAPESKVVPKEDFSKLLDAEELIQEVKKDAEKYRAEVITECEKLKEQAQKEGFEEGFKEWLVHIESLEKEIQKERDNFDRVVIPVALASAKKIIGREIEISSDTIIDIVTNSLKAVSQHKKITIYVNKKDLEILEKNRPKIKTIFESLESLSLREREDITTGGCVIETEGGIINAQLENKWKLLETALTQMKKNMVMREKKEEEKVTAVKDKGKKAS